VYRDRLKALATVQSRQDHTNEKLISADLIAAFKKGGQTCVQVFFYRSGQNWGNKAYFPRHDKDQHVDEVLSAFISQFYDNKPLPKNIFINSSIKQKKLLEEALTLKAESKVTVTMPQRGASLSLIQTVEKNARDALDRRIAETSSQVKLLEGIALLFGLDATPSRIEVYDNSHISGTSALGAMIVSGVDGFEKASYRKFNIKSKDLSPGDDFGMMREVLTRRFKRQLREDPDRDGPNWPDLLLIDGGKGQLSAVLGALEDLGLNEIPVVCIAKGKDRNAGSEDFYMVDKKPFKLPPNDPVLYFLQRLRDESHRFVIGSHRSRRAKNMHKSLLDDLPSVGLVRKKHLLLYFGSAKAVSDAGITDLNKVKGISNSLATQIYDYFHP
ncbi:MAG: excinuclease ABC subunit UvrC, partial [Kordiimonadaceae bacterium]|nr:excinuclease ABC subunit UvrC [Kordiimonadaceae bacterium]